MKKVFFCLFIIFGAALSRGAVVFGGDGGYCAENEHLMKIFKTAIIIEEEAVEAVEVVPNTNYVEGTDYGKAVPDIDIFDTETDPFFENSVFIGDSLMVGFQRYCEAKGEGFLGEPLFFAVKSFSLKQAIKPVTEKSLHPVWQGKKMTVEDIIAESGAERAFLFFGINDMVGLTAEETINEYSILLYRIHDKAPDCKVYVIGPTYVYVGGQRNGLTNDNLRSFNNEMYKFCLNYDYMEFINIGDRLIDGSHGLQDRYTSDKYVHMTGEAYDVWVKVLRANAKYFMAHENDG